MKSKRPPLTRMLAIDQYIRGNHFPDCADLAELVHVDRRMILNDIDFMQKKLGAPVAYDEARKGYYYKKNWALFPELNCDKKWEAQTDSSKARFLGDSQYLECHSEFVPGSKKSPCGSVLPDNIGLGEVLLSNDVPVSLVELELALARLFKVCFSYRDPWKGHSVEGIFHPYHLHYSSHNRTWHLVAYYEKACEVQNFDLSGFTSLRCLKTHFKVKEGFSLEDYLAKSFNEISKKSNRRVIIRFSRKSAPWVKRKNWHPTQHMETEKDGSVTLTLDVCSLDEVKQWVLHFGSEAEVEEPEELRYMIKEELVKMGERYLGMY